RLSAKEFIGGRDKMRADQTSFAEVVRDLGLERGIEGSRATHQRVQSYYGAIERQPGHATITPQAIEPRVLRKGIFSKDVETPEAVAARVTAAVREGYGPTVAAAAGARQEREKARQAQETARSLRDRLKPVLDALGPLNRDMQAKAAQIIKAVGEKLLAEQREATRQRQAQRLRSRGRDRDDGGLSR
ncbi:plasmid recombination enzyme, partial [Cutibacterium acnes]